MAQPRVDRPASADADVQAQRWHDFVEAWEALTAEIAKLSPDEQERLERELNEAVDSAIRRRVEHLDREAEPDAGSCG